MTWCPGRLDGMPPATAVYCEALLGDAVTAVTLVCKAAYVVPTPTQDSYGDFKYMNALIQIKSEVIL